MCHHPGYPMLMLASFCLYMLFTVGVCKKRSEPTICKDSPEFSVDETMNLLLQPPKHSMPFNRTDTEKTTSTQEDSRCPGNGFGGTPPLSTCPHYTVLNYDPNRIPQLVFEARCRCKTCLTETGSSKGQCKPVYYYRHVLQKDTNKAKECYFRKVKAFSVGCHCIGYNVQPDSPKTPR
ncbi:interleukin 17-like protein [Haliotis rubra]|uniref:interleukin 17-like protein n=1 Tax=Haliotis rubra TaxID=36100 RepID=UPI001EE63056|nr:interleukin 17-like protein [Haliotis rubra]